MAISPLFYLKQTKKVPYLFIIIYLWLSATIWHLNQMGLNLLNIIYFFQIEVTHSQFSDEHTYFLGWLFCSILVLPTKSFRWFRCMWLTMLLQSSTYVT